MHNIDTIEKSVITLVEGLNLDTLPAVEAVRLYHALGRIKKLTEDCGASIEEDIKRRLEILPEDDKTTQSYGGASFYYRKQFRSSFDSKAFKKDAPDVYAKYTERKEVAPYFKEAK